MTWPAPADPGGFRSRRRTGRSGRGSFRTRRPLRQEGHADDGRKCAIKGQFAQGNGVGHGVLGQDFQFGQEGERGGQVENAEPSLGRSAGDEIDRDALGRQGDVQRGRGRRHAVLDLETALSGSPHNREGGHSGGDGALHLDHAGINAFKGNRVGVRNHGVAHSTSPSVA